MCDHTSRVYMHESIPVRYLTQVTLVVQTKTQTHANSLSHQLRSLHVLFLKKLLHKQPNAIFNLGNI